MPDAKMKTVALDISLRDFAGCETLADWYAVLDGWRDLIPEAYRATARIECVEDLDIGLTLESAYYTRPETDADRQLDARRKNEAEAAHHSAEYREYLRLKAKYESSALREGPEK